MKKHRENNFNEKFRLLNSQGSAEEINWSSSDSNEFENVPSHINSKCNVTRLNKKRKRKQKELRNITNLNITFMDTPKTVKQQLDNKVCVEDTDTQQNPSSPILYTSQCHPSYKSIVAPSSPILVNKESHPNVTKTLKSPIITLRTTSPKVSPKVRKKLYDFAIDTDTCKLENLCKLSNDYLDKRKSGDNKLQDDLKNLNVTYEVLNCTDNLKSNSHKTYLRNVSNDEIKQRLYCEKLEINNIKEIEAKEDHDINCTIQETPDGINIDDSMEMLKTSSKDLVKHVKSYFDSHFSSESSSQITISEVQTPKSESKTSEDIEIISTITQVVSNRNSSESVPEYEDIKRKEKKFRYRKDGLAYRLNAMVKKQTASISLWEHEKFLAASSNFVIPKGEYRAFRIRRIQYEYGSYLLEAVDKKEDNFLILINKTQNITHNNVMQESFIKIYEPFRVLDFQIDYKLIVNVCKFEFVEADYAYRDNI